MKYELGERIVDICEYKARLQNETRHPWEDARARMISDIVGDYFCRENGPVRLLDFGCGDGFVSRTLIRRYQSCSLVGVDHKIREIIPSEDLSQEKDRIKYIESLEDFDGEDGSFDGALLLDVLEHIADDDVFLPAFFGNKVFSEQARFIITCPAFGKLFSRHDVLLGHFRRYSLTELKNTIERAGGMPLESGYIFFIPLVLRVMEVILEKAGFLRDRETTHIADWRGGAFATRIISRMLYYDALFCRLLRKVPQPGLTCYVICRKQSS